MPIVVSKHTEEHDTSSLWACLKGVPKSIRLRAHPLTLAFAVTDFKLQGKTTEDLLLSIAPRPLRSEAQPSGKLYIRDMHEQRSVAKPRHNNNTMYCYRMLR